ncbi:MAG: tetratricopeptide repeat protein [Candidatus Obscuribacterales bacterium]|nr:tetratricopeptide repeat protein [Candidatus Obscuribacterales bacterium]
MRPAVLVLFLCSIFSAGIFTCRWTSAAHAAKFSTYDDVFFDALILKAKKRYKEAGELFAKASMMHPSDPEPWALRAHMMLKTGQWKEAEIYARRAIALDKQYEQPVQYLANSLLFQNKLKEGIAECRKCLALNPGNDWSQRYLRIAEQKLRLPITDIFEGRITEDRPSMEAIAKYLQDQKYDDALKLINKHIAKYPTNSTGYLKRAYVYEVMRRRDLAIKDYDKVLSMYPCHEDALDLRAQAYQSMKQAGKSVKDLIKLVRNDTDHWNSRFRLAFAYMEAGDYNASKREYTGLLKVYPNSIEGLTGRGLAHLRAKEYKESIADYSQAIKCDPERSGSMHYKRGLAYEKLGERKKAAEDLAISKKMGYDPKDF